MPKEYPLDAIRSSEMKLDRARLHFEDLKALVDEFRGTADRRPYTTAWHEEHAHKGEYSISIHMDHPPDEWSLVLADAASNLRAALDHLAYGLAVKDSTVAPRGTEFPIFVDEAEFNNSRRGGLYKIRGITNPEARAVIESAQPYQRRKQGLASEQHLLWVLQELNNIDKHRRPHLSFTAGKLFAATIKPIPGTGTEIVDQWTVGDGRLVDDATVVRWTVRDPAEPYVEVDLQIGFSIGLDEGSPMGRGDIVDNIHLIGRYIGGIRNRLIPFLRPDDDASALAGGHETPPA